MDKGSTEMCPLSTASSPASVSCSTVLKEPELVTIVEDMPLTTEQIEEEQLLEAVENEFDIEPPNEGTPLLRSSEMGFEKSGSSFYTHNSKSFTTTFTTSQASLFIPSLQFSLYSSMVSITRSLNGSLNQRSVALSIHDRESSRSKSGTVSLLERMLEDGRAPTLLALWNLINMTIASSSVIAFPYAIALGGFAALFLILVIGFFAGVTSVLLIDCLYEISPKSRLRKRVRASYAEIGADAWGPIGGRLVDFITVSLSYSSCVLCVMVLGKSVKDLLSSQVELSLQEWCLMCAVALLLTVFIKTLSVLAWLSMLAVIAVFIIVFVLLGFSLGDYNTWEWGNIPSFDLNTFPISLGIILFSFCGHTVFPGIEVSMQEPKEYKKVSHWGFSMVTALKFLVGLFCCLTFGSKTQSIVLLNLSAAHASILSKVASLLVIINVYFSYPLNMFVVSGTLDILLLPKFPLCYNKKRYNYLWVLSTRVILVFSTLGIALAVPHFGLLMSVFGSVFGACITLIFPCLFHLQLKWNKLQWYHIAFELLIILFGVGAGVLGLIYSSIALKNATS